jgi:hypothetical protein
MTGGIDERLTSAIRISGKAAHGSVYQDPSTREPRLLVAPRWEADMPRASWRGFLRPSLVSCPIYLAPATSRTKPIRLHQVWRPAPAEEADAGISRSVPNEFRKLAEKDL